MSWPTAACPSFPSHHPVCRSTGSKTGFRFTKYEDQAKKLARLQRQYVELSANQAGTQGIVTLAPLSPHNMFPPDPPATPPSPPTESLQPCGQSKCCSIIIPDIDGSMTHHQTGSCFIRPGLTAPICLADNHTYTPLLTGGSGEFCRSYDLSWLFCDVLDSRWQQFNFLSN